MESMAQTDMIVSFNDGTDQTTYSITESGKVYFSDEELYIDETGTGNPTTIQISIIKKIFFDSKDEGETVSITNVEKDSKKNLILYPNPVRDYIKIGNLSTERTNISIYNLRGQLMLQKNYIAEEQIDVRNFPKGYYVVIIDGKILKFCKL